MLDGEDALRFCLKNLVTIEQFFVLYLIARRDFHLPPKQSLGHAYVEKLGMFNYKAIEELVRRGFLEDFNSPGEVYPEMFALTPLSQTQFADYEMATELWESYPVTFRLGDKGKFIARAGGDKQELLEDYLRRINHHSKKHVFVLEQLKAYAEMVNRGELNGYKIGDFIRQEMWDTIAKVPQEGKGGDFGKDI